LLVLEYSRYLSPKVDEFEYIGLKYARKVLLFEKNDNKCVYYIVYYGQYV